jgi:hypothetical protein
MTPAKRDYFDSLRACFLGHLDPSPEMAKTLENVLDAWNLMRNGYPKFTAVEFLMKDKGLQRSQAYKLIQDAFQLFGNLEETSKVATKLLYIENFKRLAKLSEDGGDYYTAGILLDKAAKIEGAFEQSSEMLVNPEDYKAPPVIHFTSDKAVYIRSQRGAEDAQFEEVKE